MRNWGKAPGWQGCTLGPRKRAVFPAFNRFSLLSLFSLLEELLQCLRFQHLQSLMNLFFAQGCINATSAQALLCNDCQLGRFRTRIFVSCHSENYLKRNFKLLDSVQKCFSGKNGFMRIQNFVQRITLNWRPEKIAITKFKFSFWIRKSFGNRNSYQELA